MGFKISLAGDLGSGKSTVAAIITERTGATYHATGAIMREVAARYGMDITTFNRYAETHPETDHEIDDGLVRLSDDPRDLIIDSRMAWHFTRGTFRVYMTTEPEISAARIMAAKRETERFGTLEETAAGIVRRRESEKKRYKELYNVDLTDFANYYLIIDTSYATPEAVAGAIMDSLAAWQSDPAARFCLLCPARILVSSESGPSDVFNSIHSDVGRLYGLRENTSPEKASTATLLSDGKFFFPNFTKTPKNNRSKAKNNTLFITQIFKFNLF